MKKIKIEIAKRYRKYYTLEDMDNIKEIKNSETLDEEIEIALDIARAGGEILKVTAEWFYNHADPESTYFGNGIEIGFTIYVLHECDRFEIINATMKELMCKTVNQDYAGYGQIYRLSDTFKHQ